MVLRKRKSGGLLRGAAICVVLLTAALVGCGGNENSPGAGIIVLESYSPSQILLGTEVHLIGEGFIPLEQGFQALQLDGTLGDKPFKKAFPLEFVSENELVWQVDAAVVNALGPDNPPFSGAMSVIQWISDEVQEEAVDSEALALELRSLSWLEDKGLGRSEELPCTFQASINLVPRLEGLGSSEVYLMDRIQIEGDSFLSAGEGYSLMNFSGVFIQDSPPLAKEISGLAIPLETIGRETAWLTMKPDLFGIRSGVFTGKIWITNSTFSGDMVESTRVEDVEFTLMPSFVESVDPSVVRRGQLVVLKGRGFLPGDHEDETASLILLSGSFMTKDNRLLDRTGGAMITMFPERVPDNRTIEVALRVYPGVDGKLEGLGLIPGDFTGEVSVELFHRDDSVITDGFEVQLDVANQLQVVYLKYLPSFDESMERFGMSAALAEVKATILKRCRDAYADVNLEFRVQRPEEFVEYSIIELAGKDPNDASLLGLDNTSGKDNYNIRFNDVIGGKNAETEEAGYYAFGGVFLDSFINFSPTIAGGKSPLESPLFDEVFSPFIPELGGTPITESDLTSDQGATAIHVLGNLLGSTVVHEIGHSLGLAMVPGHDDEFHNLGDNPGWIMDAGVNRPFEERGALEGAVVEFFSPFNQEYLNEILPKDE